MKKKAEIERIYKERRESRMDIDKPPVYNRPVHLQEPRHIYSTPPQAPLSDAEFAILMSGRDPRPQRSPTFSQYLEQIGRGAVRPDTPRRHRRPDPPRNPTQPILTPRRPLLYKRK